MCDFMTLQTKELRAHHEDYSGGAGKLPRILTTLLPHKSQPCSCHQDQPHHQAEMPPLLWAVSGPGRLQQRGPGWQLHDSVKSLLPMTGLRGEIVILTHDEALKCWGKVTGWAVKRKVSPSPLGWLGRPLCIHGLLNELYWPFLNKSIS